MFLAYLAPKPEHRGYATVIDNGGRAVRASAMFYACGISVRARLSQAVTDFVAKLPGKQHPEVVVRADAITFISSPRELRT